MYSKAFIKELTEDPEIKALQTAWYEKSGKWIPFYSGCFDEIEDYKNYLKALLEDDPKADRFKHKTTDWGW